MHKTNTKCKVRLDLDPAEVKNYINEPRTFTAKSNDRRCSATSLGLDIQVDGDRPNIAISTH